MGAGRSGGCRQWTLHTPPPCLTLCISSIWLSLIISVIISQYLVSKMSLSSISHSSKWTEPENRSWEPLLYAQSVRSTGDNLDLQQRPKGGGKQSCGTEPLTYRTWCHREQCQNWVEFLDILLVCKNCLLVWRSLRMFTGIDDQNPEETDSFPSVFKVASSSCKYPCFLCFSFYALHPTSDKDTFE